MKNFEYGQPNAEEIQKLRRGRRRKPQDFLHSFRDLCETFATSAFGCPIPLSTY